LTSTWKRILAVEREASRLTRTPLYSSSSRIETASACDVSNTKPSFSSWGSWVLATPIIMDLMASTSLDVLSAAKSMSTVGRRS